MDVLVNIFVGSPVFVNDPDPVDGEIFWINKSEVYVHTSKGKTVVKHFSEVSPKEFYNEEFFDSHEEPSIIQETQLDIKGRNIEEQIASIINREETESSKQKDFLSMCISQNLGFSDDIPLNSIVIYKCLLQWGSFEAQKTSVFDRILKDISSQITQNRESKEGLAYWLSDLSMLLILIIKVAKEIKTKFPAAKFRQNLVSKLDETYKILRNNIKTELSHAISLCTSEPIKISQEITVVGDSPEEISIESWQQITKIMDDLLETLKANHVSEFLVYKLFKQLFAFINVGLFNGILLNSDRCSMSYGEYVKVFLNQQQLWCLDYSKEFASLARHELKHIKEAAELLILKDKPKATFMNITRDLCSDLSLQQLSHLCTAYSDDRNSANKFSSDVLAALPEISTSVSYLLNDDLSIPFSLADISKTAGNINQVDIDLAAFIRNNPNLVTSLL